MNHEKNTGWTNEHYEPTIVLLRSAIRGAAVSLPVLLDRTSDQTLPENQIIVTNTARCIVRTCKLATLDDNIESND